jgi:hypothetical protein
VIQRRHGAGSRAAEVRATLIETRLPFPAVGGRAPFMGFASRSFLSTASLEVYVYSILIRSSYVKKNLYISFTSLILIMSFFVTIFLDLLRIFIHTGHV